MSYGGFGITASTFADGAIGGSLTRRFDVLQSAGNIMAFPFMTDLVDLTGNHTIDDGTPTLLNTVGGDYTYDGGNMLRINTTATEAPRILAATQAHQVPRSSPVSFGCFVMADAWGSPVEFMVSGPTANRANYGLQRTSGSAGWRTAGANTQLGDHRSITGAHRWFHIALVTEGSRSTSSAAEFYINGTAVWTGSVGAAWTVASDDNFGFGADNDESTAAWTGFISHCFVADSVLSPATIQALSDEAFGAASPYAPPEP